MEERTEEEKIARGAVSHILAYSPLAVQQQNIFGASRAARFLCRSS